MADVAPIPVEPDLPDSAWPVLRLLWDQFGRSDRGPDQIAHVAEEIRGSLEGLTLDRLDRLATKVFLGLVNDLSNQGWAFQRDSGKTLRAYPPGASNGSSQEQQEVKRRIRASLVAARNEQLAEAQTAGFLRDMERPRWHGGREVSILDLFTSAHDLRRDLERRLSAPEGNRDRLLFDSISPYLQVATAQPDKMTGLRLLDIWRYCRYTWSMPFHSQPGRRRYYLVRDAARDYHPIVGIGALGNSMVQIGNRDEAIGWTVDSVRSEAQLRSLHQVVDSVFEEIYWKDLLTPHEVANPTADTLKNLKEAAENAPRASRKSASGQHDYETVLEETLSPRFVRKRAVALRAAALAKLRFDKAAEDEETEGLLQLLDSSGGRRAVKTALRIIKKRHVGSSIMDITTCGGIPPYSTLLSGKLVGLLMASPQIVAEYRERYADSASVIATRMKGEPVFREAELAMLATTSLYHVGSSQYNRLKAPTRNGELQYREIGLTQGFGSVHISGRTYRDLQEYVRAHPELEAHSNRFAAGVNYKIRTIASVLSELGLSKLQKHRMPRIVYIIPLANNWQEYLTGDASDLEYIFDTVDRVEEDTQGLIDYWKERWYIPRVKRDGIIQRLEGDGVGRISQVIPESRVDRGPLFDQVNDTGTRPTVARKNDGEIKGSHGVNEDAKVPWKTFMQLVDDRASFAERLTPKELDALHIETKMDSGLLDALKDDLRIYLTGNPGDGKTHLIRRYEKQLNDADVLTHLDASATDEDGLAELIAEAVGSGRGAVIAINEGPLRKLVAKLPETEELAIRGQLDRPYLYGSQKSEEGDALVVNLGTRQLLTASVIYKGFNLALNRVDYNGAPEWVQRNVQQLGYDRVQERITAILVRVGRSGTHYTMHQLLSFFAFIVFGKGNASAASGPDVSSLLFDLANPLRDGLADFDPAGLSHPLVDRLIWDGDQEGEIQWLHRPPTGPAPRQVEEVDDALQLYAQRKRRFFLEAGNGDVILEMIPADRRQFVEVLHESSKTAATAKAKILEALSLFYGDPVTGDRGEQLEIWTGLRYEALGPPTAYTSSLSLAKEHLTLLLPRLRPRVAELIEYSPDHVKLALRSEESDVGLIIDLDVWLALMKIKRGLPQKYHDPVVGRRLEDFMSQVAASRSGTRDGYMRLKVRDVQGAATYTVDVSVEQRKYRL